jgi:hypothetical protein
MPHLLFKELVERYKNIPKSVLTTSRIDDPFLVVNLVVFQFQIKNVCGGGTTPVRMLARLLTEFAIGEGGYGGREEE